MLIACQAWEGMYQGLHGIEALAVLEVKDIEDAKEQLAAWGNEESEQLIYSYGLEDEYLSEFDEDEEIDITESYSYCDHGWRGYIVREGAFESETAADEKLCSLGYDSFVEEYCESEVE